MDYVVAQRRGQPLPLAKDVADAILDDLHCAAELALFGGRERLRERVREDDIEVAAQVDQQRLVTQQRECTLESAPFGCELHQRVGLG